MFRKGLLAALVAVPALSLAGPTGLNLIPIADVLGHREFLFMNGTYGTEWRVTRKYTNVALPEVGLFDRFEVGLDNDYLGNTVYNGKFQFYKDSHSALAVGVQNMKEGTATPFVVGRYDFNGFRVHGGWMQDNTDRMIAGLDCPTPWDGTAMFDYISGPEGSVWAGWSVPIKQVPGLSVMGTVGIPLKHGEAVQHGFLVAYGFRL